MARRKKLKVALGQTRLPFRLVTAGKDSRWRKLQTRFRWQKWIRRMFLVFLVGAGLFMSGIVLGILRAWHRPPAQLPLTELVAPGWEGQDQLNLLVRLNDEWLLVSLVPEQREVKVIALPNLPLIAVNGTQYRLSDLTVLGLAQNPPQGFEFVVHRVEAWAQVPLDGYFYWSGEGWGEWDDEGQIEELLGRFRGYRLFISLPQVWRQLEQKTFTNLRLSQLVSMLRTVQRLPEESLGWHRLHCLAEEVGCAESLAGVVRQTFTEERIVEEGLKIQIFNASGVPGLARETMVVLSNLGMEVIEVGSREPGYEHPAHPAEVKVYGNYDQTRTVRRIEQVVGVKAEVIKDAPPQRADVVVTLYGEP